MAVRYEDRLMRVLHYICDNISGDLSLDRLADVAAMSRFHWHRVYHAMTGETCAQTVRRMRLHVAAGRLLREKTAVDTIAREVGYDNPKSFAHAFRAAYGQTPQAFRKNGRLDAPYLTLRDGREMTYPVEIRNADAVKVIGVPHTGPYMEIGRAFETLGTLLGARGLMAQCGPILGIYFDDVTAVPEAELRSMAGAVWKGGAVPEGFESADLSGGRYAVLTFKGPYAQIEQGYDELMGVWLPKSGEEPRDAPCYEIYLNDPRTTAPSDLLTEIHLPLVG
ncbi:MAG: AraC family transcriptional regulator [Rhodobacterales bacterium]|nr:MAG: AraC family transcriptional regulator [Rhodobacterales bacterium]